MNSMPCMPVEEQCFPLVSSKLAIFSAFYLEGYHSISKRTHPHYFLPFPLSPSEWMALWLHNAVQYAMKAKMSVNPTWTTAPHRSVTQHSTNDWLDRTLCLVALLEVGLDFSHSWYIVLYTWWVKTSVCERKRERESINTTNPGFMFHAFILFAAVTRLQPRNYLDTNTNYIHFTHKLFFLHVSLTYC